MNAKAKNISIIPIEQTQIAAPSALLTKRGTSCPVGSSGILGSRKDARTRQDARQRPAAN